MCSFQGGELFVTGPLMAEILHHLLSMKPYGKMGIFSKSQQVSLPDFWLPSTPIGSMYGINFRWFLLVNVVMDPMGILWISSPPISTFSGYTLLSWHLGFGCWGFGWFLALEGSDRFGNCEQRPNRTFVENPKHQDYTWKCTIYIQYIWYSNLMCVCVHMTGTSG